MVETSSNSAQTMGFMILDPNNDRGHQIDVASEKGQEYQGVRIFGKDTWAYLNHLFEKFPLAKSEQALVELLPQNLKMEDLGKVGSTL